MNQLILLIVTILVLLSVQNVSAASGTDYMYNVTHNTAVIYGAINPSLSTNNLIMAIPSTSDDNPLIDRHYDLIRCIGEIGSECSIIHRTPFNIQGYSINTLLQGKFPIAANNNQYTPLIIADIVQSNSCIQSAVILCTTPDCTTVNNYPLTNNPERCCKSTDGTVIPCIINSNYNNPRPVIGGMNIIHSTTAGLINCPYLVWVEPLLSGYTVKYSSTVTGANLTDCPSSSNTNPFITDELESPIHYVTNTVDNLALESVGPYILVSSSPIDPTNDWALFLLICTADGPLCSKSTISFFSSSDWPINSANNLNLLFNSKGFPQILYTNLLESNTNQINLINCLDRLCSGFTRKMLLKLDNTHSIRVTMGLGIGSNNNPIIHYIPTDNNSQYLPDILQCNDEYCKSVTALNYYSKAEYRSIKLITQAKLIQRNDGAQYILQQLIPKKNDSQITIAMVLYTGQDQKASTLVYATEN